MKAITARVSHNVQSAFVMEDTLAQEKIHAMGSHATKMPPLLTTSIETVKSHVTHLFQAIQGHMEYGDCKTPCTWALEII